MTAKDNEQPMCKTAADSSEIRQSVPDHPRWYAVYTWARHEKKVAQHFEERGITYFLPLYTSIHNWNKKSAKVSEPLFPGYVFVQTLQHRRDPLGVPGVVQLVGMGKSPTEIPAEEIESLRTVIRRGYKIAPHPYLTPGDRVRIASGPMAGTVGTIKRTSAGCRIVISVDILMRSVAVEVDAASLIAA